MDVIKYIGGYRKYKKVMYKWASFKELHWLFKTWIWRAFIGFDDWDSQHTPWAKDCNASFV